MSAVTLNSKYQVVIPKEERKRLKLRKGQKLLVVPWDDMIVFVPDRDLSELEGAFPKLTTENIREEEDRH